MDTFSLVRLGQKIKRVSALVLGTESLCNGTIFPFFDGGLSFLGSDFFLLIGAIAGLRKKEKLCWWLSSLSFSLTAGRAVLINFVDSHSRRAFKFIRNQTQ